MLRPGCYRLSIRQEATQPTARCHGLKRTCARAACTFVHSFRVHTGTETEREWERTTRRGENGSDRERERERRGRERRRENDCGCKHISTPYSCLTDCHRGTAEKTHRFAETTDFLPATPKSATTTSPPSDDRWLSARSPWFLSSKFDLLIVWIS